jgi:hypothetical protein
MQYSRTLSGWVLGLSLGFSGIGMIAGRPAAGMCRISLAKKYARLKVARMLVECQTFVAWSGFLWGVLSP